MKQRQNLVIEGVNYPRLRSWLIMIAYAPTCPSFWLEREIEVLMEKFIGHSILTRFWCMYPENKPPAIDPDEEHTPHTPKRPPEIVMDDHEVFPWSLGLADTMAFVRELLPDCGRAGPIGFDADMAARFGATKEAVRLGMFSTSKV
eukprot:253329-Pyramimonas_sp.AAC.1